MGHRREDAGRVAADLVVVAESACVDAGDYVTFDVCAKKHKLVALRDVLSHWERALLLDDTVAVRGDAPDVFALVPTLALGATVEDTRVRPAAEAAAALRLACARYGVADPDGDDGGDARPEWFNSGVLVASWVHLALVARLPRGKLDRALHWDQGFLNAMRRKFRVPLVDLGYAFNYVGSFLTSNARHRPLDAPTDAFFVHGTTGLLMAPPDRDAFLRGVADAWAARGL